MQGYRLPVDDHRRVTIDDRVGALAAWAGCLVGHPRDGYAIDLSEGEPVMTAPPLLVGSPTTIQFLAIGRSLAEFRVDFSTKVCVSETHLLSMTEQRTSGRGVRPSGREYPPMNIRLSSFLPPLMRNPLLFAWNRC